MSERQRPAREGVPYKFKFFSILEGEPILFGAPSAFCEGSSSWYLQSRNINKYETKSSCQK